MKTIILAVTLACLSAASFGADKLSDLVDPALTESQAIPAWAAGETYQPGTERTAPNPDLLDDDGNPAVFIWQMKDAVEHTAGAAWDNAERALWTPLGVYVAPTGPDAATSISALVGGFVWLPACDPTQSLFSVNGQTIAGGATLHPDLAAKWPAWVSGSDIVLPDWRGRAMMATGALGITGAVGATYSDETAVNGLRTTLRTRSTAGGNAFNEAVAAFTNTANLNQQGSVINQMSGDAETRPNAVGLVLCVIASSLSATPNVIDHFALTTGDSSPGSTDTYTVWGDPGETEALGTFDVPIPAAELPTAFQNHGIWNGVNLQTLVANGMIIGNGTGAAGTGAPHGAFTGSCKVTAIGDWIQQDFLTSNAAGTVIGERFSRQSFNGGATWSQWLGQ